MLVFAAIYHGMEKASKYFLSSFYESICKEKFDKVKKEFFIEKCCHTTTQIFYFTFVTVWGYKVLVNTDWLPYDLGGSLPIKIAADNAMVGMPFATVPESVVNFCMITMGYHFHDLIHHVLFKKKQTDYYEMLLHHIIALTLYFCMNFGGVMGLGSVVSYLHYIADIPTALVRLVNSTIYFDKSITIFFFFIGCWFWTRILIFSQIVYALFVFPHSEVCMTFMMINFVFLSILLCIHVFYLFLCLDIVFNRIRKG